MDSDVIVVGGGPAGLTAARYLAEAGHRVLLLEKESFGGWPMNLELVVNYPSQGEKVAGHVLASQMVDDAQQHGVRMEQGDVTEIENYSRAKAVTCADGRTYTSAALILAAGLRSKPLNVPGEARLQGRGVIHCAACDASLYAGKVVAVCGGGRAGVTEALLLARYASKVILVEAQEDLGASPDLSQLARANPVIEIRCFQKPIEVHGSQEVTSLEVLDLATSRKELLKVDGVLAHVGFEPVTDLMSGTIALDDNRLAVVNEQFATDVPGIFAVGDVRCGSPRSVASAVSDAASVASSVDQYLKELKQRQ